MSTRVSFPRWWIVRALVFAATLAPRAVTLPEHFEDRDAVYFTAGVESYSVAQARPHFPGYPVYIWAGKLFALFAPSAADALHWLSIVATSLCVFPLMAIAGAWRRRLGAGNLDARAAELAVGLLWAANPLSWLAGSEILSDPFALLLALVLWWMCDRAFADESRSPARDLLFASALAGLLVGARLSYAPLAIVLALPLLRHRAKWGRVAFAPKLVLVSAAVFIGTCALWFVWQLAIDGAGLFTRGAGHVGGHFGSWGGSVATDQSLLERPARFFETLVVHGLGAYWTDAPALRIGATLAWCALLPIGLVRFARLRGARAVGAAFVLPYAVWMTLAHDVDLARYFLPTVAFLCVAAAIALPRGASGIAVALVASGLVAVVSVPLAREHQTSQPPDVLLGLELARLRGTASVVFGARFSPLLRQHTHGVRLVPVSPHSFAYLVKWHRRGGQALYAVTHELDPMAPFFEKFNVIRAYSISKWIASRGPRRFELRKLD